MGALPAHHHNHYKLLKAAWLDSPLGPMLAIADEEKVYLLEFVERRGLEREIERLRAKTQSAIVPGRTAPIISIEIELEQYFKGILKKFKTPLYMMGSPFQKLVWENLLEIPYGEIRSYRVQALAIDKPTAFRAVANANGCDQMAIVIPCHRVIHNNGGLSGYGGGQNRKIWLLNHEKKNM